MKQGKLLTPKIFFLLLIFLACKTSLPLQSQIEPSIEADHFIKADVKNFYYDKLNQLYILTQRNEIIKYGNLNNQSFRFSDYDLGEPNLVDVSNPLKILVYYPDFQTIIFLDNTLSPIQRIILNNIDYQDIRSIALANDNNIWIYDEVNSRLKKITTSNDLILDSDPLHLLLDKEIFINEIIERNNEVYLKDPINGLLIFDNYANYKKSVGIEGIKHFQILNNELYYQKNDRSYYKYIPLDFKEEAISYLPKFEKSIKTILSEKYFIVGKKEGIYFYDFKSFKGK